MTKNASDKSGFEIGLPAILEVSRGYNTENVFNLSTIFLSIWIISFLNETEFRLLVIGFGKSSFLSDYIN